MIKSNFPFHLVSNSPWPLYNSLSIIFIILGSLNLLVNKNYSFLLYSNLILLIILYQWWRDVTREATYQGTHRFKVTIGLKIGISLFILSELIFFFSFFWTYFHLYLSPNISLGLNSPPINIIAFNPYNIPLLNTLILLSSGGTLTLCHHFIINNIFYPRVLIFLITLLLRVTFTTFQYIEYLEASFTFTDSIYGSIFFIATGFHGLHVIIGTLIILIRFLRFYSKHLSYYHHFRFESSSWYWHFVDIIWLFLYIFIYWLPTI